MTFRSSKLIISGAIVGIFVLAAAPVSSAQPAAPSGDRSIIDWQVLGPLSTSTRSPYYRAQLEIDYLAAAGGESSPQLNFAAPIEFEGESHVWATLKANAQGRGAFRAAFPTASGAGVFYAAAILESPGGAALLKLSTGCSQRVWLNGRQITDVLNPIRELETDTITIPVDLVAGRNQLLLKVSQGPKAPAEFGAILLPAQITSERVMAWLPFFLIIVAWAGIAGLTGRMRAGAPDGNAPNRLVSIDALRGFDMFWITGGGLIVMRLAQASGNYGLLDQLDHQTWNGFHFWDLIFPLFIFIVGASIPFAFARRRETGASARSVHWHIVRRAITIFVVGLLMAGGLKRIATGDLRIAGVLQRIAICYCVASFAFLHLRVRTIVWLGAGILLVYWAVMALVPVPGFGAGVLLPDRNLANWLDLNYLPGRMYQGTWDNEGILSTIPAIVTCFIGVLAGAWLRTTHSETRKAWGLAIGGAVSLGVGWIWDLFFPVNKLLWSSSYVLVAGGCSLLLLALFYWMVDVRKWRRWSFPFVVIGANAIAVYAFEGFINFHEIATRLAGGNVAALFGTFQAAWLAFITYLLIWGALYWMYKRRIFIKL